MTTNKCLNPTNMSSAGLKDVGEASFISPTGVSEVVKMLNAPHNVGLSLLTLQSWLEVRSRACRMADPGSSSLFKKGRSEGVVQCRGARKEALTEPQIQEM